MTDRSPNEALENRTFTERKPLWSPHNAGRDSPRHRVLSEGSHNAGSFRQGYGAYEGRDRGSILSGSALSPEWRTKRLTRNTTVMTLHSDSESDLEEPVDNPEDKPENGFKVHQSTSEPTMHHPRAVSVTSGTIFASFEASSSEFHINSHDLGGDKKNVSNSPSGSVHESTYQSFFWQGSSMLDEDGDEDSGDQQVGGTEDMFVGSQADSISMFSFANELSNGDGDYSRSSRHGSSEDEGIDKEHHGDEDEGIEDQYPMGTSLGNYLMTPMGYDDEAVLNTGLGMEGYVEAVERFQNFAEVEYGEDPDHGSIEGHSFNVISKARKRDQERIQENKRRQGKLLLVSLLDNFCVLYDQSPERNRKLFYVICKTLSNMGIIDEEYLEEMSAVRSSYQRAFRSLVISALTSIKQEQATMESRRIMAPPSTPTENPNRRGGTRGDYSLHDSPRSFLDSIPSRGLVSPAHLHTPPTPTAFPTPTAMMRTLSFGDMFDNDPTRYKHDFVEICKLGRGGFASVFKARNKLDAIEYAIKKIRLRGGAKIRYEKIFREIKFLARLDHKNVIRYYSSWLEHADYPVSRREMYQSGGGDFDTNGDFDDEYDDEYGDEDEYTNTATGLQDELSLPPQPPIRRKSIDYFGPHSEQHAENPEDLSMGIVFGLDGEDETGVDICFDDMSKGLSDLDESDAGHHDMDQKTRLLKEPQGEEMERTHSASSTLTSRSIPPPPPSNERHRPNHKAQAASQDAQRKSLGWEELDDDMAHSKSSYGSSRHSHSLSLSALSSSIEEIQRSLPSSYSGSGLGSRYGHSMSKEHRLATLDDDVEYRPFSFPAVPSLRDLQRKGPGSTPNASPQAQRDARKGTGKLITRDLTLFIQMQLCQTTLQDYLVYRNERPSAPRRSSGEGLKRPSKSNRFGILSSSNFNEQKTQSTPGSPLEQTCHTDLVDPAINQHIFQAIVEGVAYIHAQDMIHRDLKPGNIFLGLPVGMEHQYRASLPRHNSGSNDTDSQSPSGMLAARNDLGGLGGSGFPLSDMSVQGSLTKEQIQEELFQNMENMVPKIGDFGLVTDMDGGTPLESSNPEPASPAGPSEPRQPLLRRHSSAVTTGSRSSRTRTTAVGTVTYASPEQLAKPNLGYDQKADIYSLGIIFFELYHPFSTLMERHAVLRTLRNGELPPDFVSRWPKETAFVLWLMAEDPQMRPTAAEILDFDLIRKHKEETAHPGLSCPATASETNASRDKATTTRGSNTNESPNGEDVQCFAPGETLPRTEKDRDSPPGNARESKRASRQGLGVITTKLPDPPSLLSTRIVCERCQARCRCSIHDQGDELEDVLTHLGSIVSAQRDASKRQSVESVGSIAGGGDEGRRLSRSRSSKSRKHKNLEKKLDEESEKVKRLEQSMTAIRAENKALLDRIQELEYEKELSWRPVT
ncbi:Eukaryotic translation initiation factor 2-alpha kinase [Lunasporangiospora selenospora]|uniref:Eukaryotic translation initiation factor 2-alpha kinase 1 n=1 Tax=Lunasporangiospora selenospora TaxID=979761 RepID=A0A9P6KHM2_9FUNG|nr:Eukaryotic translation initiation factor 2-alpha kinase [Lunasporangiospora selenospora]